MFRLDLEGIRLEGTNADRGCSEHCGQSPPILEMKKASPSRGKEGEGVASSVFLFLLFEGKRKLEALVVNRDAQNQLLGISFAIKPNCPCKLVVWRDRASLQC